MNEYQRLLHHHLLGGGGTEVSSQRKGLLEGSSPLRPGQGKASQMFAWGLASHVYPFHLPLPCTVAQPHLSSHSPGPEPSKATLQSDAPVSNKLPGQPSQALRTGIWQNRHQPQTCRQPHHSVPGGWYWVQPQERPRNSWFFSPIKQHRAAIQPLQG